jgi:uncharacterized LabA/DUF88 family protein
MKKRVIAFVDGFNLYHAIANLADESLKWVNISELIKSCLPMHEEIVSIFYFTALLNDPEKRLRHKMYIKALESCGINVIYGRFSLSDKKAVGKGWVKVLEEKETDVNIAIHMIKLAFKDEFDTAVLISADSDQVPTIKLLCTELNKEVRLLLPPNSKADELKSVSSYFERITREKLIKSLFPDKLVFANGLIVQKPKEWV